MTLPTTLTKNRELFVDDPVEADLPNRGTTTVAAPGNERAWRVLRYELSSFVCTGEYQKGLDRILSSYVTALREGQQYAAWVSGFYGSGKSHMVRVLEHLWKNTTFPDGRRARELVGGLPDDLTAQLRELDTIGRRGAGVWAAAGQVSGKIEHSMREELLRVVFEAAGLPTRPNAAEFAMWLKREQLYDDVVDAVRAAGRSLQDELEQFSMSELVAEAVLAAKPNFAADGERVLDRLETNYPVRGELDEGAFLSLLRQVLELQSGEPGAFPCTVIVLDELQAAINDNADRVEAVRAVVQRVSQEFDGQVMIVATGQAQLSSTPLLERLVDRFTVRVHLSDNDITTVVREVALRKKPEARPQLETLLTDSSGEIDRQLGGTRLASRPEDRVTSAADYPILPTRRRFQEELLKVDIGGTDQLRTQLRFAHEAARAVGDEPIGTVVAGDFWYDQAADKMLGTGVLDREVHQRISDLVAADADGLLKSRICKVVFLVNLVAGRRQHLGLAPDETTIADLLVERLGADAIKLRDRVPGLIAELVDHGQLLRTEAGYEIETEEGAAWNGAYREQLRAEKANVAALVETRTQLVASALQQVLGRLAVPHGESKQSRACEWVLADAAPDVADGVVPVWIRDTDVTQALFEGTARAAGLEDPTVHVRLADHDAEQLRDAIARSRAAKHTLATRPAPGNDAGRTARTHIDLIRADADRAAEEIVAEMLAGASVLLSGGQRYEKSGLRPSVEAAALDAVTRMFSAFASVDHARWHTVVTRAREGNRSALEVIGHPGEPDDYEPAKRLMQAIQAGKGSGRDIRQAFADPPYGWPRDAVDGMLLTLAVAGVVRVRVDHDDIDPRKLTQQQLPKAVFSLHAVRLSKADELAVRAFVKRLVPAATSPGISDVPRGLDAMQALAERSTGDPPLPGPQLPAWFSELRTQPLGPEQALGVAARKDDLIRLAEDLERKAGSAEVRMKLWRKATTLTTWARQAGAPGEMLAERHAAILEHRQLLDDPDPVGPLLRDLTELLTDVTKAGHARLVEARAQGIEELKATPEFSEVPAERWKEIVERCGLGPLKRLELDTHEALTTALAAWPPADWDDKVAMLELQFTRARGEAARSLAPEAVTITVPGANLHTRQQAEAWIEELSSLILSHIDDDTPVIIVSAGRQT